MGFGADGAVLWRGWEGCKTIAQKLVATTLSTVFSFRDDKFVSTVFNLVPTVFCVGN